MNNHIKKYLEQILSGILTGISIFTGISICVLSIYAFNWSGVSTVTSSTTLTAGLRNTTMATITGSIQTLQDTMVALTGDQTVAGIKTFSSPIVAPTPTVNNQLATKAYVDSAVSAAGGTCDGTILKIKFTLTKYTGNLGGKAGGDAKCNLEYPGYHMCDITELKNAGAVGCLPNTSSYMGLTSLMASRANFVDGVVGYNCLNWTVGSAGLTSSATLTLNGSWDVSNTHCEYLNGISCCK